MFVLTVDQHASRRVGDRVEALLADLAPLSGRDGVVRAFERTVGDEVQAVLRDAGLVVDVALQLLRTGGWSVGIGAGPVDEPLPASARAGSGQAFVLARTAVERAKSRTRPVALAGRGSSTGPAPMPTLQPPVRSSCRATSTTRPASRRTACTSSPTVRSNARTTPSRPLSGARSASNASTRSPTRRLACWSTVRTNISQAYDPVRYMTRPSSCCWRDKAARPCRTIARGGHFSRPVPSE